MVLKIFRFSSRDLLIFWILLCEMIVLEAMATNGSGATATVQTTPVIFTLRTEITPELEMRLYNPGVADMEYYMKTQKKVINYLTGFKNEFQRTVVGTQMKFCPYVTLCDFTVSATTDQRSCCKPCHCTNCDPERTCCPSIMDEMAFTYDDMNFTRQPKPWLSGRFGEHIEPTCILQHLTIRPSYEQRGFKAVSDCPTNTDSVLGYNCSRPYTKDLKINSTLPVFSNASLLIFRNKYCARCNGVGDKDIVSFYPMVSCEEEDHLLTQVTSEKDVMEIIFSTEECDMSFGFSDPRVRMEECKYVTSKCNVTGFWKEYDVQQEIACHLYESKFSHDNYEFRNVFCAMCNGMTPHTVTCNWFHTLKTDVFSFSGLLNLDFDQGFSTAYLAEDRLNQASSCKTNQIYDALMNRCKDIFCPKFRVLRGRQCVNIYSGVTDVFSYVLYMRMKPAVFLTASEAFGNESNWYFNILDMFSANFSNMRVCDAQIAFKLDMKYGKSTLQALSQSRLMYADVRIRFAQWSKEPWTDADNLLKLHGSAFNFDQDINKSTKYIVYVMDGDARQFKIIKSSLGHSDMYGQMLASTSSEKRIEIMSEYALTDTDGLTVLPYSLVFQLNMECHQPDVTQIDVMQFSSCPKVNVSKKDIPWTQSIDGLIIKDLKIPSNEYYYIDHHHIMTCMETFQKIVSYLEPKRTLNAEVIVSIVTSTLSLISLLITLGIFCAFPSLKGTLPGKNNMSLAAYLLIAQTLFLVGSLNPFAQYSVSCKVVGFLIHFSWLGAIFWMNVCTYHMFRVLSQTKQLVNRNGLKQFIFYHCYVFTMSVLFVLANVISSHFVSGNFGYGGKFCYIISEEKILLTFVFPTILVIAVNLLLFLYVITKIKRAPEMRRHVQNEHNELVIFAKLSTITGCTWVFGFLYIWSGIQALSYVFTVLNASQGVFIMFGFVLNRKVMLLIKDSVLRSARPSKTSDNGSGTDSSKL